MAIKMLTSRDAKRTSCLELKNYGNKSRALVSLVYGEPKQRTDLETKSGRERQTLHNFGYTINVHKYSSI